MICERTCMTLHGIMLSEKRAHVKILLLCDFLHMAFSSSQIIEIDNRLVVDRGGELWEAYEHG